MATTKLQQIEETLYEFYPPWLAKLVTSFVPPWLPALIWKSELDYRQLKQLKPGEARYKICFVGPSTAGKTTFINALCNSRVYSNCVPDVQDNCTKRLKVKKTTIVGVPWDTMGESKYDKLRPLSYSNTDMFILCFDLAKEDSFRQLRKKFYPEVMRHIRNSASERFVVVGLKSDLKYEVDDQVYRKHPVTTRPQQVRRRRKVRQADAITWTKRIGAFAYYELSSLVMAGTDEMEWFFNHMCIICLNQPRDVEIRASIVEYIKKTYRWAGKIDGIREDNLRLDLSSKFTAVKGWIMEDYDDIVLKAFNLQERDLRIGFRGVGRPRYPIEKAIYY